MSETLDALAPRVSVHFICRMSRRSADEPLIDPAWSGSQQGSCRCAVTNSTVSQEEENDPHFEPVIKLTEQVETKTGEEDEDVRFKMYVPVHPSLHWPKN